MSLAIPRTLVEYLLLGPDGDRRQLQDSPILADVWIAFAKEPDKAKQLLITPYRGKTAGSVSVQLDEYITSLAVGQLQEPPDIAYLQGVIAARLSFHDVLKVIVPLTDWWRRQFQKSDTSLYLDSEKGWEKFTGVYDTVERMIRHWSDPLEHKRVDDSLSAFDRYAALAGLILWASHETPGDRQHAEVPAQELWRKIKDSLPSIQGGLQRTFVDIVTRFPLKELNERDGLIFQVSLNRECTMAVARSIPAVKADAARTLFTVNCSRLAWAVLDAGIQGNHRAFVAADGESSRVKSSFDFTNIRRIMSLDSWRMIREKRAHQKEREGWLSTFQNPSLKEKLGKEKVEERLEALYTDAKNSRPINWELVKPFLEIDPNTKPTSDHGTHVAGIIGANRRGADSDKVPKEEKHDYVDGMCPDIQLYDFRVLAPTLKETEFAIIAALQFIRHINQRNEYLTIHGANLSLSIPHDVRNYACGRTPVCIESERLVDSGVVVVAAAGNRGYQSFETKEGLYDGYAAFSVTDPGNADGVITVGATHRYSPHTYGVSFFSSRGPTGDGRMKPDLVAPGERICAPFRDGWGVLDGTSMAAPHVSGAAAMLMARYSEFIGDPQRIKRILCESATDLSRERSFQGRGMLDVLRAFQSV